MIWKVERGSAGRSTIFCLSFYHTKVAFTKVVTNLTSIPIIMASGQLSQSLSLACFVFLKFIHVFLWQLITRHNAMQE